MHTYLFSNKNSFHKRSNAESLDRLKTSKYSIQPKLLVGQSNVKFEQEADHIAEMELAHALLIQLQKKKRWDIMRECMVRNLLIP